MALAKDRNTKMRDGVMFRFPVAADAVIFAGAMAALEGGYLVPASDTADLTVVGRAEEHVDNAGGADGAQDCTIRRGVFGWKPSAANAPTASNIGDPAYVEDDETVSAVAGANSIVAGTIRDVREGLVWVETGK